MLMRRMVRVVTAVGVAAGVLGTGQTALAGGEKGTAVIKGVAKLDGKAPKLKGISMAADPYCNKQKKKLRRLLKLF